MSQVGIINIFSSLSSVDRADGGLLVESVEAELALVGRGVGQRLGLLDVLLKFLLKNIKRASTIA